MRLPQPFYRLSVRFDAERLAAEVAALPAAAWAGHPNDIPGNSSVRLISVDGGENDLVDGAMAMTASLRQSPYMRQVLSSFGVVWGRSRLMRLAPGVGVPQHSDINHHWFTRVRLHIPVVTRPEVRFHCGDQSVHMAAGECWLFDNWRQHRVENPTAHERIHLVADTSGSSSFWQFVARSRLAGTPDTVHRFDPAKRAPILTEQQLLAPVMPPAEVDLLATDLRHELQALSDSPAAASRLAHYDAMLENLCRDWRQLYVLHGESDAGRQEFARLRDSVRVRSRELGEGLVIRSVRVEAHAVLEGRLLRPMLPERAAAQFPAGGPARRRLDGFVRPLFIVAAPRSGSTLLFETLTAAGTVVSLGGEGHELIEGLPELRVGGHGVDSNRLTAGNCTRDVADKVVARLEAGLTDVDGTPVATPDGRRLVEKTPKNALRVPFFDRLFPDARFVLLWRDPAPNIGSIIDAWQSGRFKTYNGLDGFDGPWSLLLPPGWRMMNARPLAEIAAFQWEAANRFALDDLESLPRERWTSVRYADLLADPPGVIERLCGFADIEVDARLRHRLAAPLPLSRHTGIPPAEHKWRRHADAIEPLMAGVSALWDRLKAL